MKKLLIDIGNSFCKVALYDGWELSIVDRVQTQKQGAVVDLLQMISKSGVRKLVISSVANAGFNQKFKLALNNLPQTSVLFVDEVQPYPRLSCIYAEPKTFGVDRWMAMIGGLSRSNSCPYYVIDFGTAINADLVDGHGRHQGGHIMPNSRLMTKALLQDTQKVNVVVGAGKAKNTLFGDDTAHCVSLGIEQMILSYLERMLHIIKRQYGGEAKIFVTGEGIPTSIVDALSGSVIFDPYLLLRGMLLFSEHVEEK